MGQSKSDVKPELIDLLDCVLIRGAISRVGVLPIDVTFVIHDLGQR